MPGNSGGDSPSSLLLNSFEAVNRERIDSFDSDIRNLFTSAVSYERGRTLCEKYLQGTHGSSNEVEGEHKRIPTRNILLISFTEHIPEGVNIHKPIHLSYYGINIPLLDGKGSKTVKFKDEIHVFLLSFDKTVTTDLSQEMDRMNYFVSFLKNADMKESLKALMKRKAVRESTGNTPGTQDDFAHILYPDKTNPLLNFVSGEDLDARCGIHTRNFLVFILDIPEDDIADWTHVFFHDSGIYYLSRKTSTIGFIPPNQKYISYFDIEKTAQHFNLDVKKGISRGEKMWEFGKRVQGIVAGILDKEDIRAIKEHGESVPPIYIFTVQMKEGFGVAVSTENMLHHEVFGDSKKLQRLVDVLSDISPIVRRFFQNGIFFGKDAAYRKDASLREIGLSFKKDQSRFLSPTYMDRYFSGKKAPDGSETSFDLYTHELEYLEKHEQFYPFFMYLFLGRVFKKLLHLASKDEEYREILKNIEDLLANQLDVELQGLSQNGFDKKTVLAKNTVYINYFMRYGCAYIMEKRGKPLQITIPEAWRIFLRDKVFLDYERIT